MTPAGANRVVIGSLFAVGVLDVVHDAATGHRPTLREGLGLTLAGFFLAAMTGPAPTMAAGFALVLLVSSLYTVGGSSLEAFRKAVN